MRHHRPVEALLLAAPQPDPAQAAVFSHHDLGIEHVLVDPATGTVTGVIDWADAAIVDPAFDFGLVLRDLGPDALDAALTRYPSGAGVAGLRERALFYARCSVLEDLEHGVEMGRDASVVKCVDSLGWLFPG
jgi:aminoglycoside phosphotransferase (APT) family kinase protein